MNLEILGFDNIFKTRFNEYADKQCVPARIISQQKNSYIVCHENGITGAKLAGKFLYKASVKKDYPAVGDWVTVKLSSNNAQAIIIAVLPRKTAFSRKLPISGGRKIKNGIITGGATEEQVIAANVDIVFIVSGLDDNFNIQRIERYITLAYNSGALPVIILNKIDCCDNFKDYLVKVENIAPGIAAHPVSVTQNMNMDIFYKYLSPGKTVVFLGSSGVGKSTITNYLIGEEKQKTNTVSSNNNKGRHTTTSSQLIFHDNGAMIIDTPGLRELQLWGDEDALNQNFDDIVNIISKCKYRDCQHHKEPGCAIKEALENGILSHDRFESYVKQAEELQRLEGRIKESKMYLSKKAKIVAKISSQKRGGNRPFAKQ